MRSQPDRFLVVLMRRSILLCATLALAAAGRAEAAAVAYGPMIETLSTTTGTIWVGLDATARVRVRYKLSDAPDWTYVDVGDALGANDFTMKIPLKTLKAGHQYAYAIGVSQADGSETWTPKAYFNTVKIKPASVSFTVLGDFANAGKGSSALASAAATRPNFLAVIGDMDHSAPAIDPTTRAYYPEAQWLTVLQNMRAMHRRMRDPQTPIGAQMISAIVDSTTERPQIPFFEVWDDHDYCANDADVGCPFRAQAFQAWQEYFSWPKDGGMGDAGCGGEGVYQKISYGDIATIFMLDARSNRTPATMLGDCQLAWLIQGLQAATTVWKFILSPVVFNPATKAWDSWGAYNDGPTSDRQQLLAAIQDGGIHNVVVISADLHSGGAIDDGTHAGLPEVSTPHANMPPSWVNTFCKHAPPHGALECQPGTWTLGTLDSQNAGSNADPPYPLDGRKAPGFVRVDATATSASLQILGAHGGARMGYRADGTKAVMRLDLVAK